MGAKQVCSYAKDLFVEKLGYDTAVIMSEDFAWTKPYDKKLLECLPKIGLKVIDHIRISQGTVDFSPIYSRIRQSNPDVIIAGLAHLGVRPTVQWHQRKVPSLLAGWSGQTTSGTFWERTNGAAEGMITGDIATVNASITPKTIPFAKKYIKRYGATPAYTAYSTYDAIYILKNAIERADSTDADALVESLEKTDYVGTQGRLKFRGRDSKFVHELKYGKGYFTGIAIQWQDGEKVVIWPKDASNGEIMLPDFVKQ